MAIFDLGDAEPGDGLSQRDIAVRGRSAGEFARRMNLAGHANRIRSPAPTVRFDLLLRGELSEVRTTRAGRMVCASQGGIQILPRRWQCSEEHDND